MHGHWIRHRQRVAINPVFIINIMTISSCINTPDIMCSLLKFIARKRSLKYNLVRRIMEEYENAIRISFLPWSLALSACFTYALTSFTSGNARLTFCSVAICPARQPEMGVVQLAVSMVIYKQPKFGSGGWPTPQNQLNVSVYRSCGFMKFI